MSVSGCLLISFQLFLIGKNRHLSLGKGWLFSVGNGRAIRPIDKGRKYPSKSKYNDYGLSDHLSGPVSLYLYYNDHVNFK